MKAGSAGMVFIGSLLLGLSNAVSNLGAPTPTGLGSWSGTSAMRAGRAEHTAVLLLDGRVLVAGGTDGRDHGLPTTELFDPRSGRWTSGPAMSSPRVDHTATLLADGRVLVAGGFDSLDLTERSLASTEIFDPARNRWLPAAPMSISRARHTATLLTNGRVLVVGGYSTPTAGNSIGFTMRAEIYDPQTNQWSATKRMGTGGRQGHTSTLLRDGRVLVAGGEGFLGGNPSVEMYDPTTNSWAFAQSLLAAHVGHTATLLAPAHLLIIGGAGSISPTLNEPAALNTAEVYDPLSDRWTLLAPMHTTRDHHTATLLRDGRLLVAGGALTSTPLPELYDPVTNTWALIPGTSMNRYAHTATPLDDGRVLITGGYNTQSMASAWIYDPSGRPSSTPGTAFRWAFAIPVVAIAVVGGLVLGWRRRILRLPSWPSRGRDDAWIDP